MSSGESIRMQSREVHDALGALDRLLNKHEAITEDQALRAARMLLRDDSLELPLDFAELRGEKQEPETGPAASGDAAPAAGDDAPAEEPDAEP